MEQRHRVFEAKWSALWVKEVSSLGVKSAECGRALDYKGLPFRVQINAPFYSPRNQQRLEQIKADFDNGRRNYHPHELIEESARGKALA